ncbi:MAG: FAD-dependent monooxygenase [Comamonas sp.]
MQKQILIAGGGIGGLAAALAASQAGMAVRLFERAEAFGEIGAGVQLGPNVVRCLQAWGLRQALQDSAAFPQALVSRNAITGAELARMPLAGEMERRYGAPYATIHRADLHQLLLAVVQPRDGIQLNLGCAVESHTDDGRVATLTLSPRKAVEGDALIAADGVWSQTRQRLLGDGPPRVTGHLAYRGAVRQADLPAAWRTQVVTAWMGPHFHVVHYPVRRGELLNVVVIVEGPIPEDREQWDHAAHAADMQRGLAGAHGTLQAMLQAVTDAGANWRLWPLADRPPVAGPQQMAQGLVALLGDAAHPMRPYLAQGAGMAIEDAFELQAALALRELDMPLRLRRYALNRWQRNARVQARSLRNGAIFHATGAMRWGRDWSLRLAGARLMDMPWLYGPAQARPAGS